MTEWKYEKRYCGDCEHYSRIAHFCRKKNDIFFEGGCKQCGTARPQSWIYEGIECEDFEYHCFDDPSGS